MKREALEKLLKNVADRKFPVEWATKKLEEKKAIIIVGGGTVATNFHFPRIQKLLDPYPIYIIETDPFQYKLLTERYKINQRVIISKKIPDEEFYLAVIATPPKFHFEYFEKLKGQTSRFIIEKPLALNAEQANELNKHANKNKILVFVNMIRRTLNHFVLLRKLYELSQFGSLIKVDVAEGGVFGWNVASMGSFSKDLNGGGVLMDTGPHTIDLLVQFFDTIDLEASYMDNEDENSIEANCILLLKDISGIPITVNLSRNRNLSNLARFEFEDATCLLDLRSPHIYVERTDGVSYKILSSEENVNFETLFDMFYEKFIVPGNNNGVSPSESIKGLEIIQKAYEIKKPITGGF